MYKFLSITHSYFDPILRSRSIIRAIDLEPYESQINYEFLSNLQQNGISLAP